MDQRHLPGQQALELAVAGADFVVHQGLLLAQYRLHHPLAILAHDIESAVGDGLHGFHIHFLLDRYIVAHAPVATALGTSALLYKTDESHAYLALITAPVSL